MYPTEEKRPYVERAEEAKNENVQVKRQFPEEISEKPHKKAKGEYTINTRISLPTIVDTVKKLNVEQLQAVKEIGLGGLLDLKCSQLDRDLCGWLLRNFDPDQCCLTVHGRQLPITPVDVEKTLGLRSKGVYPTTEGSPGNILELSEKYGFVEGVLKVRRLREDLSSSVDGGEMFMVRFALLALGCMCCPGTKSGIKSKFMHLVKDVSLLRTLNWGKLLLDHLLEGVRRYKMKKSNWVGGCLFFLMIFYFENAIPVGAPPMPSLDTHKFPRIGSWGNKEVKSRMKYIKDKGLLTRRRVELVPQSKHLEVEDENKETGSTDTCSVADHERRIRFLEKEVEDTKVELLKLSSSIASDFQSLREETRELIKQAFKRALSKKDAQEDEEEREERHVEKKERGKRQDGSVSKEKPCSTHEIEDEHVDNQSLVSAHKRLDKVDTLLGEIQKFNKLFDNIDSRFESVDAGIKTIKGLLEIRHTSSTRP